MRKKADHLLDFRESITPFMLLKVRRVFRKMEPDKVIEIISSDRSLREDIIHILPPNECTFQFFSDDQRQDYRIWIQKKTNE